MHFGVPDPMIFGPLKIYGRPKLSQRRCPYRRHSRAAEQGEGLVAVHSSCEHGAAPEAGCWNQNRLLWEPMQTSC